MNKKLIIVVANTKVTFVDYVCSRVGIGKMEQFYNNTEIRYYNKSSVDTYRFVLPSCDGDKLRGCAIDEVVMLSTLNPDVINHVIQPALVASNYRQSNKSNKLIQALDDLQILLKEFINETNL